MLYSDLDSSHEAIPAVNIESKIRFPLRNWRRADHLHHPATRGDFVTQGIESARGRKIAPCVVWSRHRYGVAMELNLTAPSGRQMALLTGHSLRTRWPQSPSVLPIDKRNGAASAYRQSVPFNTSERSRRVVGAPAKDGSFLLRHVEFRVVQ